MVLNTHIQTHISIYDNVFFNGSYKVFFFTLSITTISAANFSQQRTATENKWEKSIKLITKAHVALFYHNWVMMWFGLVAQAMLLA